MILTPLAALVLAAAAPFADLERELPIPPIPELAPSDLQPPAPVAVRPAPAPVTAPAAPAEAPAIVEDGTRTPLLGAMPFVEGGYGGVDLQLTGLGGSAVLLSQATVDFLHGAWSAGLGFTSGGSDALGLSYLAARGGYQVAAIGAVDLTAGFSLGAGLASRGASTAVERVGVVAMAPELTARARLLPWLRAHATLSYRLVNAGAWGGPPGDEMSGAAVGIGLDFGRFE